MSAPSVIERVKTTLVALKMPRALEILDVTLRGIERGEIGAVEAIDALLTEELTTRENRRVRMAVQMARLSAIKTLAGFDFAFQPSLDRNRILALAGLQFIDRAEALHLIGPPGTGKNSSEPRPRRRGGQSRSQRLLQLARRHRRRARQGRTRRRPPREDPLLLPLCAAHRRRDRLPPGHGGRRQSLLPARQRPVRKGAMILTSNRGFAEWGDIFGDPVVATALLDRLLHHAAVIQIEGSSYRLREHADLLPETGRFKSNAATNPIPATLKRRGRPPKNRAADYLNG